MSDAQRRGAPSPRTRLLLRAGLLLALGSALWWTSGELGEPAQRSDARRENVAASSAPEALHEPLDATQERAPTRASAPAPTAPSQAAPPTPQPKPQLIGTIVNGAGGAPPRSAQVVLSEPGRSVHAPYDGVLAQFSAEELSAGPWQIEIRTPDFHELVGAHFVGAEPPTRASFELWPRDWLLVHAVTTRGERYAAIAWRLGLSSANVFSGGFRLWSADAPPADPFAWPSHAPLAAGADVSLAAPRDVNDVFDPRDVARIRRSPGRTLWIALALHERFLGWKQVAPQEEVVRFELDDDDLTEQLGSIALRAVDAITGAPETSARATLESAIAERRRADTSNISVDARGEARIERVIPGAYELVLHAPGRAEDRRNVNVASGQQLDLGTIALERTPSLEVVVLDVDGQPVLAQVQLGAWRAGALIDEVLRPRAFVTGEGGAALVPLPREPTLVRATRLSLASLGLVRNDALHGLALFDPSSGAERLELRLVPSRPYWISHPVAQRGWAEMRVLNELDIAVGRVAPTPETASRWLLTPGRYRASYRSEDGVERASYAFTLEPHTPLNVELE